MKKVNLKTDVNLLIISYLTDSITEKDLAHLNDWINASNENRSYFNELKDSWILSGNKNSNSSHIQKNHGMH